MKTDNIVVDNLKCGGCGNTITKQLKAIPGVKKVSIDFETSTISVGYESENDLHAKFLKSLSKVGYPAAGTSTTGQKIKSYVSCVIGRMSD